MFIKEAPEYKNSLTFAKIFKRIKGYEKKAFASIYAKINSAWDNTEHDTNVSDTEVHLKHEECKYDPNSNVSTQRTTSKDIYEIGIKFHYWFSLRHHPHYIAAKYSDLKTEMINNTLRSLGMSHGTNCKQNARHISTQTRSKI
eukprot:920724_1